MLGIMFESDFLEPEGLTDQATCVQPSFCSFISRYLMQHTEAALHYCVTAMETRLLNCMHTYQNSNTLQAKNKK